VGGRWLSLSPPPPAVNLMTGEILDDD
jgi:hypothetical protein